MRVVYLLWLLEKINNPRNVNSRTAMQMMDKIKEEI